MQKPAARSINPNPENKASKGRGNRWEPTDAQRQTAKMLFGLGATQEQVAQQLGVGLKLVKDRLREEYDLGWEVANLQLYGALWKAGVKNGNIAALIFLAKNRLGMSDRQDHNHTGDAPPMRAELSLQVTYVLPGDSRALPPPPPERLPPPFKGPA